MHIGTALCENIPKILVQPSARNSMNIISTTFCEDIPMNISTAFSEKFYEY